MSWTPQIDSVSQLTEVLSQSVSPDNQTRSRAKQALDDARQQPDLDNYLVYLLATPQDHGSVHLRATAGVLLKNNIKTGYSKFPEAVQSYIKSELIKGLIDSDPLIRNISGNAVTTLVSEAGVTGWPDVFPTLMNMAENGSNVQAQEGAMSALGKICEDSASELDKDFNGERPLNYMIPKFLQFTQSPSAKVRSQSVFCLSQFIIIQSQSLLTHLDDLLNALFYLASNDSDSDIRRNVCSAFVSLLEVRPDKLLPHLEGVINYTLHCIKDEEEQVASEGCEFILGLAETTSIDRSVIEPHLPKILPIILSTMVYSEMDKFILEEQDDEDETIEDKPEDIRPMNAKSKEHSVKKTTNGLNKTNDTTTNDNENKNNDKQQQQHEDDDEEDDESDDDQDLEYGLSEWNLRKCSAAALDVFGNQYPGLVLEISLPYLKTNIVAQEWHVREAAILAFGAIAEGCLELMGPHLPSLIPFLVDRLNDEKAAVRQITAWTLGRYSQWVITNSTQSGQEENRQLMFNPVLQGLLKCCLDRNKKVQESGCSALATFIENAGEHLMPYIEAVLAHVSMCFQKYQAKNLIILYDVIQTLADHVPDALCEQKCADIILPPLLNKYQQLKDDDRDLWPLLECLGSVTASMGPHFAPYAPAVFTRASTILRDNLVLEQHHQVDPTVELPEKDFIITSLDLLDGLIQGLGHHALELCQQQQPPIPELMLVCFHDAVYEVRQSAFALLGDMAISVFEVLRPYFDSIMQEALVQINCTDPMANAVCNNAIWSVGEMSLQVGREIEPYSQQLLQRLVTVLQTDTSATVLENAAIAIGRLGKSIPDIVAPHLSIFIDRWCAKIKPVEETDEKDSAYQGMCQIVAANPSGLSNEAMLLNFITIVGTYLEPSQSLAMLISKVLEGYKSFLQDWQVQVMNKLQPEVAQSLTHRYGV